MTGRAAPVTPGRAVGTVLRGLRSRTLLSSTSLLLMVLAVAGSVAAPVFRDAAGTSYTVSRLAEAPAPQTALTWTVEPGRRSLPRTEADVRATLARLLPDAYEHLTQLETTVAMPRRADGVPVSYVARDGACDLLDVQGRCPAGPGEVLVNEDDLPTGGVGTRVRLPRLGAVTIVGSYRTPQPSQDWLFPDRLASRPPSAVRPREPAPYVVTPDVLASLPRGVWSPLVEARLQLPGGLHLDEVDRLLQAGDRLRGTTVDLPGGGRLLADSQTNTLDALADDVHAQQEAADRTVAPVVASLVLVALAMILRLQGAAARLRVPELALASLRGTGRRRLWALALTEPWLLVALATPLGVVAGWLGGHALARAWLRPGTPVDLPSSAPAAAVGVGLAIAAVTAVATGRMMTESLADRLEGTTRPARPGRLARAAELGLVVVALLLPLSRLLGGTQELGGADLLLPVAVAVAAGLLAGRLVTLVAGWWSRRWRGRRLPGFVTARALARRSEGTLVVLPVTAALAVAVFAVGVDDAAAAWRQSVADTRTPADVVRSSPYSLEETRELVDDLDPDGRWLSTLATFDAPGGGQVVLVDTERAGRVLAWSPQWLDGDTAGEATALVGPQHPLPEVAGRDVGLTVTVPSGGGGMTVDVDLRSPEGDRQVTLGPFGPGTTTRTARTDACEDGCEVLGLGVRQSGGSDTRATLAGLTVDGSALDGVLDPVAWDGLADDGGARFAVDVPADDERDVLPADRARPLPALVGRTSGTLAEDADGARAIEIQAVRLPVEPVAQVESTPLAGASGVVVDLGLFLGVYSPGAALVDTVVLAREDTPPAVVTALEGSGLGTPTRLADTRASLDDSAYALALRLYLLVAAVLLVMALLGLLVGLAVQRPGRRLDAASLRVVGVRRRALVAASLWESVTVLGVAGAAGLVAGTAALAVLLPSLTLGVLDDPSVPRVVAEVDAGRLLLLAAASAVVLVVVAAAQAASVVRGARGSTLR